MSTLPIGQTSVAIDFLNQMLPHQPWHLVAISLSGKVEARAFSAQENVEAAAWIGARQGKANLYFHVNQLLDGCSNIKAKKEDVSSALFLHVDVDDLDAFARLEAFMPPPTSVVFSGGGYQAFWRLQVPEKDLDRVERCNVALAKQLGGDNCHNVDRIMRLPGTLNIPNKKKKDQGRVIALAQLVANLTDFERLHDIAAFNEMFFLEKAEFIPITVALDSLPASVPSIIRTLIIEGDDPERPIGSDEARYPSRSEIVFYVACDLLRAGCSHNVVTSLLLDPQYKISASVLEKRNPQQYAVRQVEKAQLAISNGWPDVTGGGKPRATFPNAMVALRRLGLSFSYDQFHRCKTVGGYQLHDYAGDLTDDGCAALRIMILECFGFDAGKENVRDAANSLCLENIYHPVRDYLDSLRWDGKPRINSWLHDYLGAAHDEYTSAVGRIVLIAAVRRIRQPGVKFDTIMVLEGPQGTGKSTAIEILAGKGNYSDQDILQLDAKSQIEAMEGIWFYEIAELTGISRAETNRVKAFASRSHDKARGAYARFAERRPRECILIGTTNEDKYLRDPSGNRRFWPIITTEIDREKLKRDRDQLLAEASYWEAKGESITLPEHLWPAARKEQEARLEEDPWLDALSELRADEVNGELRITSKRVFDLLQIPPERQVQHMMKRLANCMRSLGWTKKTIKQGKRVVQGYAKPKE